MIGIDWAAVETDIREISAVLLKPLHPVVALSAE
jgi:hypothetical protein